MKYLKHFESYYPETIYDFILRLNQNILLTDFNYGSNVLGKLVNALFRNNKTFETIRDTERFMSQYYSNSSKYDHIFNIDYIIIDDDYTNLGRFNWSEKIMDTFKDGSVKFIIVSNYFKKEHFKTDIKVVKLNNLIDRINTCFKKMNENNLFENFPVLKDLKKYGLRYTLKDVKNYLNNKHQKEHYPFPEEFLLLNVIIGSRLAEYHFKECQKKRGKFYTWNWVKNIRKEDLDNLPLPSNVFDKLNESYQDNEWIERNVDIPRKDFFDKWFKDKVFIEDQGNYELYSYHNKQWDEKEQEYFWETKKLLKVDKREDITHYWEKDIINIPLYKVRHKDMTREQELTIRSWCGTERNPKYTSKYEGFEKGLAKFRSFLSDKQNGKLYHVLPDGNIVEMLPDDSTHEYKRAIIDYLLDTRNLNLIQKIKGEI
jgi:hypothetical protein